MKKTICRSRSSGRFSWKRLCGAFKRQRVKVVAFRLMRRK